MIFLNTVVLEKSLGIVLANYTWLPSDFNNLEIHSKCLFTMTKHIFFFCISRVQGIKGPSQKFDIVPFNYKKAKLF